MQRFHHGGTHRPGLPRPGSGYGRRPGRPQPHAAARAEARRRHAWWGAADVIAALEDARGRRPARAGSLTPSG
jgi:hypothetical protein